MDARKSSEMGAWSSAQPTGPPITRCGSVGACFRRDSTICVLCLMLACARTILSKSSSAPLFLRAKSPITESAFLPANCFSTAR